MKTLESELNFENEVKYHYDRFPPKNLDYSKLIHPLAKATDATARFDQMLKKMHNSEILLAPLRKQEAVISSRMEGTISTMDEILMYEAEYEEGETSTEKFRSDVVETHLHQRAIKLAQPLISEGRPINNWLIRAIHKELLSFGRGVQKSPGEFKKEQNYLVDRTKRNVLFTPISPEKLNDGLEALFKYLEEDKEQVLLKTAISHIEFEALHPFKDGNGRIGRMLITLFLWKAKVISAPHFYISGYLEDQKDQYTELMRNVSKNDDWTSWCVFFLEAMEQQSIRNLQIAESISALYDEMKSIFRTRLSSQWHIDALDFVFTHPIFRNNQFRHKTPIPSQTAARITRTLVSEGLLTTLEEPSGKRSGLYAFEALLKLVRV